MSSRRRRTSLYEFVRRTMQLPVRRPWHPTPSYSCQGCLAQLSWWWGFAQVGVGFAGCQHEPISPAIHFHPCIHAIDVVQPGLAGRSVAAPGVAHSATGGRDSLFSAAHLRGAAHLRNGTRSDIEPGADICGRAARGQAGRQAGRSFCTVLCAAAATACRRFPAGRFGAWGVVPCLPRVVARRSRSSQKRDADDEGDCADVICIRPWAWQAPPLSACATLNN